MTPSRRSDAEVANGPRGMAMLTRRSWLRIVVVGLVLGFWLSTVPLPAEGQTPQESVAGAWIGERPTSDITFADKLGKPIVQTRKFATQDLSMDVAVEVEKYLQDYDATKSLVKLRVLGIANSRIAHRYSVTKYTDRVYHPCAQDWYMSCANTGITGDDVGTWFNLPGDFYLYGRAYNRIYVCSNGWVSFLYSGGSGSSCSFTPDPLPTADSQDGQGNRIDGPDSILAPLWRDLYPPGGGQITYGTYVDNLCGEWEFTVYWENVPNYGNGYRNNFAVRIWRVLGWGGDGQICPVTPAASSFRFEYGSVSPTNPTTSGTRIGYEDPTGALGGEVPASTPQSYGIASFADQGFRSGGWLVDSKILVDKQCCSSSSLDFQQSEIAGYNIRTSNPPPPDGTQELLAAVVEPVAIAGLCALFSIGALGCLAIDLGVSMTPALAHTLSHPAYPTWQDQSMLSGTNTGFLEVPVHDERNVCGGDNDIPGSGGSDCDVDVAVFDVLQWKIPKDSVTHTLEIEFGVARLRGHGRTEWGADLLFKKPFPLSETVEF